jgi:hypothetical protein
MYCTASLNPDLPNGEGKVHPAAAAGTTMHSMYEYGLGEGKFRPWTDAEIERLWAGRFDPKSAYRIAKWGIQATLRLIKQYELKQFLLEQTVYPGIKDNAFWYHPSETNNSPPISLAHLSFSQITHSTPSWSPSASHKFLKTNP